MKRIFTFLLAAVFVLGTVAVSYAVHVDGSGGAGVDVNARGHWRIVYSNISDDADFDNESADGQQHKVMKMRNRTWFDFAASENLKGVLGMEIGDFQWGNGAGTLGGDVVGIEVKHAYVQFTWPNTDVSISAGLQTVSFANNLGALVLDDDATALLVTIPFNDMMALTAGYVRAFDTNSSAVNDEFDVFAAALPITTEGFSITPYVLYAVIGEEYVSSDGDDSDIGFWFSAAAQVTALDPIVILGDVAFGSYDYDTDTNDQAGWFFDIAVDYTGLDMLTPEAFFIWTSGNDDDSSDGDESFATISDAFDPTSFGWEAGPLDEGDVLNGVVGPGSSGSANGNESGFWALGIALKDITFMDGLTHKFVAHYFVGTDDEDAVSTFDEKDKGYELTFDTAYTIYEQLTAYVELGYIQLNMDEDDKFEDAAKKLAVGVVYKF